MCSQQEKTISDLVREMDAIKEERENEVEAQSKETQKVKITAQLKEEENYLLNDQIQKLSKSLDEERKQGGYLNKELGELKDFYKKLNEKNTSLIAQLEADNNEIKKRLVKLIKLVYRDFVINKIFFNFSIFNSDF
jgi:chromosome segregation ATPase